ncbi:N-acetylmuramic acid 6-phosphate etherase [Deinococcus aquiradiocola]|uniref:N-acetylmuramic acid 6-phosphate etherase n=1 Tax=Deinococcus aquiradiocola TaxID=393059 RepID=A0A917UN77_9DEIO|nr:N-acetylmuramic acid 6-phosphate etherase [Deinococcus aquiradiocola]GGJ70327.1 N-acetylmuramic acid 6-phosphate etherase [Deinococcus aquiradiocola]
MTRPPTQRPTPRSDDDQTAPLSTEQPSDQHTDLDLLGTPELVQALLDDQLNAVRAAQAALPDIARAADLAVTRLQHAGRLVYVGAGTSGRLGVLDGVELLPTFSWPPERLVTLIAGGERAMFRAAEGAEDDEAQAVLDLQAHHVDAGDVVIVLAASGATPYAVAAARHATQLGALTIGVSNNPGSPLQAAVHVPITLDTGSEVISGSTRLKAGTSQKIVLNALSSAIMVRLHKVYGNLMVDLQATNRKLRLRALHLTVLASGADPDAARHALHDADGHVKTAIVMLRLGLNAEQARHALTAAGHSVRAVLDAHP